MYFGFGEMVFLAIVLTLIFSASAMGRLGNALGKFVHALRKASKGQEDNFIDLPPQTSCALEPPADTAKTPTLQPPPR